MPAIRRSQGRQVSQSTAWQATRCSLAQTEPFAPPPAPLPALLDVERTVTDQALVAFRGNQYSLPPGRARQIVHVRYQLGAPTLDIADGQNVRLAHHRRAPDGAGVLVRLDEHIHALTQMVLANFSDRAPVTANTADYPQPKHSPKGWR